jgi:peptidoglycan/LPS O-acetylase OafA/YrhL
MLTATEKRFIKYWEDQREGGRIKYYVLYILTGSIVGIIVLSFLSLMLGWNFPNNLWMIIAASVVLVTAITVLTWWFNEKKFKAIIQREIREGMEKDEAIGNKQ